MSDSQNHLVHRKHICFAAAQKIGRRMREFTPGEIKQKAEERGILSGNWKDTHYILKDRMTREEFVLDSTDMMLWSHSDVKRLARQLDINKSDPELYKAKGDFAKKKLVLKTVSMLIGSGREYTIMDDRHIKLKNTTIVRNQKSTASSSQFKKYLKLLMKHMEPYDNQSILEEAAEEGVQVEKNDTRADVVHKIANVRWTQGHCG